jgi:adenosine deaminase
LRNGIFPCANSFLPRFVFIIWRTLTRKSATMIDTRLPLTDIHRHLDGNIRAQTILDLGRQFNLTLPAQTLESLIPHVQVTSNEPDLVSFLSKLDWGVKMLASLDACRRVAFENIEDAARNGLHYVELRFSPGYMAMTHNLPVAGVVEAVIEGVRRAVKPSMSGPSDWYYEPYVRRSGLPAGAGSAAGPSRCHHRRRSRR